LDERGSPDAHLRCRVDRADVVSIKTLPDESPRRRTTPHALNTNPFYCVNELVLSRPALSHAGSSKGSPGNTKPALQNHAGMSNVRPCPLTWIGLWPAAAPLSVAVGPSAP